MDVKALLTFISSCLIATCGDIDQSAQQKAHELARVETHAGEEVLLERQTLTGSYLSSQFAQRHHDWKKANNYLENVLAFSIDDDQIVKRSMVLAMGSGDIPTAITLAKKIVQTDKENSLALLFLGLDALNNKKYEEANAYIEKIPEGSLSEFLMPLLKSWAQAALGEIKNPDLNKNSLHIYHAILIADYLKQYDYLKSLLEKALAEKDVSPEDKEQVADIYAHIGEKAKAEKIYNDLLKETPEALYIKDKIARLKAGEEVALFSSVRSPQEGMATALYDMAQLLYQELSDDSARVFAHMALFMQPHMSDAELLLAALAARNERYDEAIQYYKNIPPSDARYIEARRAIASLFETQNKTAESIAELEHLANEYNDVEALIQIGDIYRRTENYKDALTHYNRAAEKLGTIPENYWHLLYARGMSYEETGEWDKAEMDLKAALAYQPNHPFVLNYLGYAWADKGVNLGQSLEMIKKAVALQPSDGYITDSLGWVYYRMGEFAKAIPHLEKAVELQPYDSVINDHLGDAYWQVGRRTEARFQWTRAKNYSEDKSLVYTLDQKLSKGIAKIEIVKEASTRTHTDKEILNP